MSGLYRMISIETYIFIATLGVVEWWGMIRAMAEERWQEEWRQEGDTFIRYRGMFGKRGWHWAREEVLMTRL